MQKEILFILCIASVVLFLLLIVRVIAKLLHLDSKHPLVHFLYEITENLVKQFRVGPLSRPSGIELAAIPPMIFFLTFILIISVLL